MRKWPAPGAKPLSVLGQAAEGFPLQVIQPRVFFRQVVRIVFCIKLPAGHFKQGAGAVEASVAVDVVVEPSFDLGEVAFGHILPDASHLGFHGCQHLGTVSAAQGVGGEVADAAAGPVGIL